MDKKRKTLFKIIIFSLIIVVLILFMIFGIISFNKIKENSEIKKIKAEAGIYITSAKDKFFTDHLLDDWSEFKECYEISENGYIGSIEVTYLNDEFTYKIWISNEKYYAYGDNNTEIKATKSSKKATTNCTK